MTDPRSPIDDDLLALGGLSIPPPSPALLAVVRRTDRVVRRDPRLAVGAVILVALAALIIHLHSHGIRRDLAALPHWWLWTMTAAWFAAFVAPLAVALVPWRHSMLVDVRAARLVAFSIPALAIAMAAVLRIDAPGATRLLTSAADVTAELEWCLVTGIEMIAVPFTLGIVMLRRGPLPVYRRWVGAALGAANGALAGLMLHLACDVGGAFHTGVSHGGQAVIGALAGSLLVPAFTATAAR